MQLGEVANEDTLHYLPGARSRMGRRRWRGRMCCVGPGVCAGAHHRAAAVSWHCGGEGERGAGARGCTGDGANTVHAPLSALPCITVRSCLALPTLAQVSMYGVLNTAQEGSRQSQTAGICEHVLLTVYVGLP